MMPESSTRTRYPSGNSPADGIRRAGVIAWSILGVLLLTGVVLWLLAFLRDIFPPLALALILLFLLNPLVSALERRGIRRWIGTTAIYLLFIAAVAAAVSLVAPTLGRQMNELVGRLPQIRQQTIVTGENLVSKVGLSLTDFGLDIGEGSRAASGAQALAGEPQPTPPPEESAGAPSLIQSLGGRLFRGASRFATGALHAVVNFVLAPILALYLLIDLPKVQKAFLHYLPPRYRREWLPILESAGQTVGAFFRGQLLVAAIVGVLSSTWFLFIRLPFWLPLGLLVGFFNIIPLLGPWVGGAIAALVGWVTGGLGLALKAALGMLLIQQFDNHFISPKVMGRAVRLHPVAVMLALVAGAGLGGIWGMLLSVPTLGVAKIVFVYFYETRVLGNIEYQPVAAGGGLVKGAADLDREVDETRAEDEPEVATAPASESETATAQQADEAPKPAVATELRSARASRERREARKAGR
ncbi:MAG: AI-2E family transporter [Actinomycetota bacterium]|nr:AI-2E family transporter [Actinomycetota bacterium]